MTAFASWYSPKYDPQGSNSQPVLIESQPIFGMQQNVWEQQTQNVSVVLHDDSGNVYFSCSAGNQSYFASFKTTQRWNFSCPSDAFFTLNSQQSVIFLVYPGEQKTEVVAYATNGSFLWKSDVGPKASSPVYYEQGNAFLVIDATSLKMIDTQAQVSILANASGNLNSPTQPVVARSGTVYALLPKLVSVNPYVQYDFIAEEILSVFNTSEGDNLIVFVNETSFCIRPYPNGTIQFLSEFQHSRIVSIPTPLANNKILGISISSDRQSFSQVDLLANKTLWNSGALEFNLISAVTNGNKIIYTLLASKDPLPNIVLTAWLFTDNSSILLWNQDLGSRYFGLEYFMSLNNRGDVFVSLNTSILQFSACSGHGSLNLTHPNFTCQCMTGWLGEFCETAWCTSSSCGVNRTCGTDHLCACDSVHFGLNCSTFCTPNLTCNGRGSCNPSNGVCICEPLWQGADCSSVWLQVTVFILLGIIGLLGIVMAVCMVRTACNARASNKYNLINQ